MKLEHLTLLRPNMGDYRSKDAMPPIAMSILAARTPSDIEIQFFDDVKKFSIISLSEAFTAAV